MPVMSFKVDRESAEVIRAKARAAKTSLSAYLRKVALGESARKPVKIVRQVHPVSGLSFNAALPTKAVTSEEIRAALADFP